MKKILIILFLTISCASSHKPSVNLNNNVIIKIDGIVFLENKIIYEVTNNNPIKVYLHPGHIMFIANLKNSDGTNAKMLRFITSRNINNIEFLEIKPKEKFVFEYKTSYFSKYDLIKGQEYILETSYLNHNNHIKGKTLIGTITASPYKFKY